MILETAFTKEEVYYNLLDLKDKHNWQNDYQGHKYILTIDNDSSETIWFSGKLIVDDVDTIFLSGFEKGSNHPTYYKINLSDSIGGSMFIWKRGKYADTVNIINNSPEYYKIPNELFLLKVEK